MRHLLATLMLCLAVPVGEAAARPYDDRGVILTNEGRVIPAARQAVRKARKLSYPLPSRERVDAASPARRGRVRGPYPSPRLAPLATPLPQGERGKRPHRTATPSARPPGVSLAGVVAPLAAKARELVEQCGARVISTVRRTRIAGSRRMSLHASGRAVDLTGPPRCLYARLRNWPGGVSTDYHRVRPHHVHVSYGGHEHGRRFVHRNPFLPRRVAFAR